MSTTEIESFYLSEQRVGVLVRRSSPQLIQTTLAFKIEDGPVAHLFQQTRFAADVLEWSEYRYVDHLEGTNVEVQADTELLPRDPASKPIPSYAAHVVLKDFLATAEPHRGFSQFSEGVPLEIVPTAFVRHGTETVQTPWRSRDAMKVVLEVDGRAGNTFWCADALVVKSDWQGATSYSTNDIDSALEDLDAEVQARVRSALA